MYLFHKNCGEKAWSTDFTMPLECRVAGWRGSEPSGSASQLSIQENGSSMLAGFFFVNPGKHFS